MSHQKCKNGVLASRFLSVTDPKHLVNIKRKPTVIHLKKFVKFSTKFHTLHKGNCYICGDDPSPSKLFLSF